jgi:hypothetical protein
MYFEAGVWKTLDSFALPLPPKIRFAIGITGNDANFGDLSVRVGFDNVLINAGTCSY